MAEEIRLKRDRDVLEVVFNRPEKRNAVTSSMCRMIADALEDASGSSVRCILFMGEGADFSVGADIAELEGTAVGRTNLKEAGRFIRALARTKAPIVASVRGRAAGIGATLLFHCDLVYVADNVEIMTHFVKLGLVPEAASTLLAPARIGYARAFALLAACETMSAKDAITCGLANHLCGPGDVDTMARAAAERLAELPASALQSTKSLMRSVDSMLAAMDREGTLFDELVKSNEATAAFDAFRARHRPTPRQIS